MGCKDKQQGIEKYRYFGQDASVLVSPLPRRTPNVSPLLPLPSIRDHLEYWGRGNLCLYDCLISQAGSLCSVEQGFSSEFVFASG